eukprot:927240-Prymnesium_polylepis.1
MVRGGRQQRCEEALATARGLAREAQRGVDQQVVIDRKLLVVYLRCDFCVEDAALREAAAHFCDAQSSRPRPHVAALSPHLPSRACRDHLRFEELCDQLVDCGRGAATAD